jgi:membrane protease YdiL (CAAX protease family)
LSHEPTAPQGAPPPWHRQPLVRLAGLFWNREERRPRALFRLIGFALLLWVSGLALRTSGLLPEPGAPLFYPTRVFSRLLLVIVCMWLAGRLLDRRRLREFGLALDRRFRRDFAFGLLLGAGLMSSVFLTEWVTGSVVVVDTLRSGVPGLAFGWAIVTPLVVFLCVAAIEELLFRGYLLRNLAEGLGVPGLGGARGGLLIASLLSSMLFAFGHASNPNATWVSTVNIAMAGLLLALGYLLSGQLGLPIGLHVSWNFFQGSVFGYPVSGVTALRTSFVVIEQRGPELWTGGTFGPEGGLVGLVAMLAGAAGTLGYYRRQQGSLALVTEPLVPPARR